jgi:7,8-dihydropterin-6-yl-methyl-4-(beta-D-ribofuranosyl)aminobenzene 5'-phosphate synthase
VCLRRRIVSWCILATCMIGAAAHSAERTAHHAKTAKITVLSTMLADAGIGEWGYAAIVEVDGHRILFDTGARPETVLANAREMRIDLSSVERVVLSHNHSDHTGGLVTLRRELRKVNPRALSIAHVGAGIFDSRPARNGNEANAMLRIKPDYEALDGKFVVHSEATELLPGVWITGPVPRLHPEKNFPQGGKVRRMAELSDDIIAEDMSLVIATDEGLLVIAGCGHAGIINTTEHARKVIEDRPVVAVIGGLHTFAASDETLGWTAQRLREGGLKYFLAGHCTGIEAAFRIRELAGLDRKTAVVSAVGSSFTLGEGIKPGAIAQ